MFRTCSLALVTAALAVACGAKPTPAPPPYRPEAQAELLKPPPVVKTDCEPTDPADAAPSLKYTQRSVDEAADLATLGLQQLKAAAVSGIDDAAREQGLTEAVELFINALQADPYNIDATYNLASAYAVIGRTQCSLNLLERLLQMRPHPSKAAQVDGKLDRLLGRSRSPLDPDFEAMRGDPRFRKLISNMCAGSSNPGCMK